MTGSGADCAVDGIRRNGVTRVVLDGDVDISNAERVRLLVETECSYGSPRVVIDLSAVEFVDSHALHLFVETHRRLTREARVLVFVPPREAVWKPFVVTGLDRVLVVDPDA